MRISYVRQGPISWESTFGYEWTRLGIALACVELGYTFTFLYASPLPDALAKRISCIPGSFSNVKECLRKTDILLVEQGERALPRFWTNPRNADELAGSSVSESNIHATWLFKLWATLREYEGDVGLIYNDPKCRAQLLPESIALRYLSEPISHWITRNKRLVVITEASDVLRLMKTDSAWENNTDMSGRGYGLIPVSCNLSTGPFALGFSTSVPKGSTIPIRLAKQIASSWKTKKHDFVYYGKPKNQRPRELKTFFSGVSGVVVGNGWDKIRGELPSNWEIRPSLSRHELNALIQDSRFSACIGDDFYYKFGSYTGRPFESLMLGALPKIPFHFFNSKMTEVNVTGYNSEIHGFKCPEEFVLREEVDSVPRAVSEEKLIKPIDTLLSNIKHAPHVIERMIDSIRDPRNHHKGSLKEAYHAYLNYRFDPGRLKTYPMEEKFITRAKKHGEFYDRIS